MFLIACNRNATCERPGNTPIFWISLPLGTPKSRSARKTVALLSEGAEELCLLVCPFFCLLGSRWGFALFGGRFWLGFKVFEFDGIVDLRFDFVHLRFRLDGHGL
jgi:hypothetical protein